jgi:hypothetical protein
MIERRLCSALVVLGTAWFAAAQRAPGRLDPTFVPQGVSPVDEIYKIVVQRDNKILFIDQTFGSIGIKRYVRRLNPDGSDAPSFLAPEFVWSEWGPIPVSALALQNDRILVGGRFHTVNEQPMVLDVYAQPGVGLTNVSFRLQFPAHRLHNMALTALHPSLGESSVMLLDQTNAVVICNVSPGQTLQGRQQLAELSFDTVSNQSSAFFSFGITEVVDLRHDGVKVAKALAEVGRIGIVGTEALLECGPAGGARSF